MAEQTHMAAAAETGARARGWGLRLALCVAVLNACLLYPMAYFVYKHYDTSQAPMDVPPYMAMIEHPFNSGQDLPFARRLLTQAMVRLMDPLPGYPTAIRYTTDPLQQKRFFHFIALNTAFTVATSVLLFLWLARTVAPAYAYVGSLLYLLAFYPVVSGLMPMTDAGCHFFIMLGVWYFDRRNYVGLAVAAALGMLQKETAVIVLFFWIAVGSIGQWRRLWAEGCLLSAAVVWLWFKFNIVAPAPYSYYEPGTYLHSVLHVFRPGTYTPGFIAHVVLPHVPVLVALAVFAWLRWGCGERTLRMGQEMLLFPFFLWFGLALELENNTGRLMFMAFPAYARLQAQVVERLVARGRPGFLWETPLPPAA